MLSDTFVKRICRIISCALGKWSLHSRWNFLDVHCVYMAMATNADQWKWRQIRIPLTNGSDVKNVFPLTNGSDINYIFPRRRLATVFTSSADMSISTAKLERWLHWHTEWVSLLWASQQPRDDQPPPKWGLQTNRAKLLAQQSPWSVDILVYWVPAYMDRIKAAAKRLYMLSVR